MADATLARPRVDGVEQHGSAQSSRDVAPASRTRALRAPVPLDDGSDPDDVRRFGVWPAPSKAWVAFARVMRWGRRAVVPAMITAVVIVGARWWARHGAPGDAGRAVASKKGDVVDPWAN